MCCQCRLLKILNKMSMALWQNVWTSLCVYLYMCLSEAGAGTATWLYVSSQGVSGWAKLCCTFSHIILLPPFSVLTVPPEREYARLLSECVSVYVGVCLACCVPPLVSGDLRLYFCCLLLTVWWCWLFGRNVKTALCCFGFDFFILLLENVLMPQMVVMTAQNSHPPFCTPLNSHHLIVPF